MFIIQNKLMTILGYRKLGGARWLTGTQSNSGVSGRWIETYRRHVVSLSKTVYSPKVLVN